MTRIGIISDTHSCRDERFAKYLCDCDEIWHCGDIGDSSLMDWFENLGPVFRGVCGNIDHGEVRRKLPELLEFTVEHVRVLMTHVGGYPGKWAPGMESLLRDKHPDMMVCGHSHILKVIYDHRLKLLHVNPGAAGVHGWQKVRTLIRLTIDGSDIKDCEVIELAKQ